MKRITYLTFFFFVFFFVMILCSCGKTPQIGELAGHWRIESIKYPDGTETGRNGCFYNFYRDLLQLDRKTVGIMDYDKPYISVEFKDINPEDLRPWGITLTSKDVNVADWYQQYHIDHLKGSSLILSTPQGSTITLSRF